MAGLLPRLRRLALGLSLASGVTVVPHGAAARGLAPTPQVTRAPELVGFVEAAYPEAERAAGRTATVGLRISLDAEGRVRAVEVASSAGAAFDAAAVAAARQFTFTAAEIDGKPAPIVIEYGYAFTLEAQPVAPPSTAGFAGVVLDRGSKAPIAGARVMLRVAGEAVPRETTTDAHGRFAFDDVPAGEHEVGLSGAGVTEVQTRETLVAGEALEVRYEVASPQPAAAAEDADDLEILVVAPPLSRQATSTKVVAEDARKVPGTSGDVVRVVESLPGVARSTAGSGQLVVWGAAPSDTRVYVDGVPIPRLYHEGGLRSVIHPKLVEGIELVPGGQGAMWGRGLAGMVAITTVTPARERTGGRVHADTLDASAVVSTPLDRRRRWHLAVGARASYLAAWGRRFLDEDTAGLIPLPSYGDGQARVLYRASSRDSVELVSIVSVDRFRRGVPDRDPALAIEERRATDFGRLYARYVHRGDDTELTVTPYFGIGRSRRSAAVGAVVTSLSDDSVLAGLRIQQAWRPRPWLQVDAGVDAELDVVGLRRVGSLGLPAREGDVRVFGQPPPDELVADRWRATRIGLAPYVHADFAPWQGKLHVIPGVRLDPYARALDRRNPRQAEAPAVGRFDQDFAVEPRLTVIGRPHWRVELRAATGLYRQAPAAEDLSATFGTPDLPTAKALHVVAGTKVSILRTLSIDVTGFFTRSRDLAMRSGAASPLAGRALEPSGTARSYGAQVLLRQELFKGVFGWIAYTWMRSERRDRVGAAVRLSDYDQPHVLTAVLAWALPRGFELGGRMRYASGFPRTPVTGAWFDTVRNRYQPEFGAHNSIRVPQFAQLDLRLAKRFDIRRTALEVFAEVLNVWNRHNAEELVYAADYSRRGAISGFPVLPVVGMQWDF